MIFKTVSVDLSPHFLCSCCNCPFGAMSLQAAPCHPSHSLQNSLTSSPLFCLFISLPVQVINGPQTCSLQNYLLLRWFVFLSTVMQLFLYVLRRNGNSFVVTLVPHLFLICVLAGREYLFPTMLALQSHICFGLKLTTGLVFSMSAPRLSPSIFNTLSQARGLTLTDNGCVQLLGISNKVLSYKLSMGLSGP